MKKAGNIIFKVLPYVLILCGIGVTYYLNYITGLYTDDFWYSTNLVTGEPLASFKDIIESQIWHYNNWGGRSIAHALLQISLMGGVTFINVCNTFCHILTAFLICEVAGSKRNPWYFLFAYSFVYLFNPNLVQTCQWQAGVANYLYMTDIILVFVLLYLYGLRKTVKEEKLPVWLNILLCVVMIPLGICSGWSNENMGPGSALFALLCIGFIAVKFRKTYAYMIVGAVFSAIGAVLVVIAPGNYARSGYITDMAEASLFEKITNRLVSVTGGFYSYLITVMVILLLLMTVYHAVLKKKFEPDNTIVLITAFATVGAMILSPYFPDRVAFGSCILFACVIVCYINKLMDIWAKDNVALKLCAAGFAILTWIGFIYRAYSIHFTLVKGIIN